MKTVCTRKRNTFHVAQAVQKEVLLFFGYSKKQIFVIALYVRKRTVADILPIAQIILLLVHIIMKILESDLLIRMYGFMQRSDSIKYFGVISSDGAINKHLIA